MTAWVGGLTAENAVYQFAATAPGTYQVMDIGRFVRRFEAFDAAGKTVPVEQVSVNQWKLSDAPRVRTIRYAIAETWDTQVDRHQVYLMCGTSMEQDHVLINPHAVIGYPTGMQARPIRLRIKYPTRWKVGTALPRDRGGAYLADDFDQLVDSPILLGRLTEARTRVTGVPVEIYTYSKTDKIKSSQLLGAMNGMLQAAGRFLGKLPVDRYTFLYHFEDRPAGAWEHSVSSEYVLQESEYSDSVGSYVTDIAAHEFFHIVTPLNIHSEIIEHFNFVTPVPSQHLWLYEGTTEWAAHAMQLRSGLKSPRGVPGQGDPEDADRPGQIRLDLQPPRARAHLLQRFRAGAVRQHLHAGRPDRRAARHPAARAFRREPGTPGPDRRSDPEVRQAAGFPGVHVRGHPSGHDLARRPGLLQSLCV